MRALAVHAGPRALEILRERGLNAAEVRVIPAAAGGPKGLILNPLDRFLFGHWLTSTTQTVHLLGASIGAWRMTCAAMDDPAQALAGMAQAYIEQHYPHEPGRAPTPSKVSELFGRTLAEQLTPRAGEVLSNPRYRLHVFTSRGRGLLAREGRWRTPVGYVGAAALNAAGRRFLGAALERVVFSDERDDLPLPLTGFRTHLARLSPTNLATAVLASCSIPFWLDAVHDIPGGSPGAYWDGGITDYHLHLDYAGMNDGLVLYPHFQSQVVPGWLDKPLKHRHRATPALSNVVVLSPRPEWVQSLPAGRLPDRSDFKRYGDDLERRVAAWRMAVAESERLADEFAELAREGRPIMASPLT